MNDPTSLVIDDKPDVEQSERHGGHNKEVHGCDCFSVVAKECHPSLLPVAVGWPLWHVARHGREAHREAELREFCMNLPSAPRIVRCELLDQCSNFGRDWWASQSRPRNPSPVEPESIAVPSHHRVRLDNDEGMLPPWPEPGERDPECAIERGQPGLRFHLIVGGKLLAKGEFDDDLLSVAAKESRNALHDERQEMEWSLHGDRDIGEFRALIRV